MFKFVKRKKDEAFSGRDKFKRPPNKNAGADAARFVSEMARQLSDPNLLLLET